jgi:hypothetical protein
LCAPHEKSNIAVCSGSTDDGAPAKHAKYQQCLCTTHAARFVSFQVSPSVEGRASRSYVPQCTAPMVFHAAVTIQLQFHGQVQKYPKNATVTMSNLKITWKPSSLAVKSVQM